MQAVISRLKRLGWNHRQIIGDDLHYLAELDDVEVIEVESGYPGLYIVRNKIPVIVLSPELKGYYRDWVLAHELGHYYLHVPGAQFLYGNCDKLERQADLIAACAVIPQPLLLACNGFDLFEEGYPPMLIEIRKMIYQQTGM